MIRVARWAVIGLVATTWVSCSSGGADPTPTTTGRGGDTAGAAGAGTAGVGGGTAGALAPGGAGAVAGGTTGAAGGPGGAGGSVSAGGAGGAAGVAGSAGRSGTAGAAGGLAGRGAAGAAGQPNLPGGASALFPPPGSDGICPDPPLRIVFSGGAPTVGTAGRIRVWNSAGAAVATVDLGASSFTTTNGGMTFNTARPVYVDGNAVVVALPSRPLRYGQTYYVTVESGAVRSPTGASFAVTDSVTWRFSTAPAAPTDPTHLAVALDGSAPFCSVQGALDAVPAGNSSPVTITIGAGRYHDIIYFRAKNNVTLVGQDRNGTVIEGTNNDNLNAGTKARALVGVDASSGFVLRNLTIHNLTPQGGSQAEALRLEGCDKCIVRDANLSSLQDTLLWSGRIYATNCLVEGNVDFVWGTGAVYVTNSEIRTVGRAGPIVQARNPASTYGYVFVGCKLTSDPGLSGGVLARIDVSAYPASHVAYIDCEMGGEIAAAGWQLTAGSNTSMLRFWEHGSVDSASRAIDVSRRLAGSKQLSDAQAATMRDAATVLAGWQPAP